MINEKIEIVDIRASSGSSIESNQWCLKKAQPQGKLGMKECSRPKSRFCPGTISKCIYKEGDILIKAKTKKKVMLDILFSSSKQNALDTDS